jgi:hypothetical protein
VLLRAALALPGHLKRTVPGASPPQRPRRLGPRWVRTRRVNHGQQRAQASPHVRGNRRSLHLQPPDLGGTRWVRWSSSLPTSTHRRDGQRNRWPSSFMNGMTPAAGCDHDSRRPCRVTGSKCRRFRVTSGSPSATVRGAALLTAIVRKVRDLANPRTGHGSTGQASRREAPGSGDVGASAHTIVRRDYGAFAVDGSTLARVESGGPLAQGWSDHAR